MRRFRNTQSLSALQKPERQFLVSLNVWDRAEIQLNVALLEAWVPNQKVLFHVIDREDSAHVLCLLTDIYAGLLEVEQVLLCRVQYHILLPFKHTPP